jgi:ribose transport system permease protein
VSNIVKRLSKNNEFFLAIFMVFAGLIVALINPVFIKLDNIASILYAASFLGVIGLAEMVVMLDGGIDISVGAIVAVCAVTMSGLIQKSGVPPLAAGILCIAVGLALGAVNGILVAYVELPPIIATLATLRLYRGVTELGLGAGNIQPPLAQMPWLSLRIGPFSISIIVFLAIAIVLSQFFSRTRFGRQIYAVGGNAQACAMVGVKVKRVHLLVYTLSGLLCSVAAFLLLTEVTYVDRRVALGTEFLAIAAIVMGGINMYGGKGKVLGAVLGAILLYSIYNALILANIGGVWQNAVTGAVIILAVVITSYRAESIYE